MKRRKFLKLGSGAAVGAPLVLTNKGASFAQGTLSPISICKHDHASSLTTQYTTYTAGANPPSAHTVDIINEQRWAINALVDSVVKHLTAQATVGAAWESLFPAGALNANTKIGIKVNNTWGYYNDYYYKTDRPCPYACKASVAEAVVSGLTQMMGGSFNPENIVVFDKQVNGEGHYRVAEWYGMINQGFPFITWPPEAEIWKNPVQTETRYDAGGVGMYRARLDDHHNASLMVGSPTFNAGGSFNVAQKVVPSIFQSDYWINICNAKPHGMAGTTLVFKNVYGCTNNCSGTHSGSGDLDEKIHACIPDFYPGVSTAGNCPNILNMMDALATITDGDAQGGDMENTNILAASRDPLTLEYYGLELINSFRSQKIGTGTGSLPDGHSHSTYLTNAQAPAYDLGNFNAGDRMGGLQDITAIKPRPLPSLDRAQGRIHGARKLSNRWMLDVQLDASGRNHRLVSRIFDIQGRLVRNLPDAFTRRALHTLEWDGKGNSGLTVPPGVYSWQVSIDGRGYNQNVSTL